jgi:hypothetical protein
VISIAFMIPHPACGDSILRHYCNTPAQRIVGVAVEPAARAGRGRDAETGTGTA